MGLGVGRSRDGGGVGLGVDVQGTWGMGCGRSGEGGIECGRSGDILLFFFYDSFYTGNSKGTFSVCDERGNLGIRSWERT